MTTNSQAELFTAILDQLDQRGAGAGRHDNDEHVEAEDDVVAPEPIRPKALASSKDWLLQLLGSMARDEPQAEPSANPAAAYDVDPEAGFNAEPPMATESIEIPTLPQNEAELDPEPTDETIAAELHLDALTTSRDLRKLRRSFAHANHPDRFGHERAALATRRMTIANMLIDRRIRELAKPHWSFPWRG